MLARPLAHLVLITGLLLPATRLNHANITSESSKTLGIIYS
jgi:hypothetical protein